MPFTSGDLLRGSIAWLLVGLSTSQVEAQDRRELRGRVLHAESGHPLPDVLVTPEGEGGAVLTSRDGTFRIDNVAGDSITITLTLIGFARRELRVPVASDLTILMTPRPIVLDGIDVISDRWFERRARSRALDLWWLNGSRWPVPYKVYDQGVIRASEAPDVISFLREYAHVVVTRCVAQKGRELCILPPFVNTANPTRVARIIWNDRLLPGSLDELMQTPIDSVSRVEIFGVRGELEIRLYSQRYLDTISPDDRQR